MDDATRKHMFEPFFTTKLEGAGTGLGLATVFSIVTQHEGDIEVETTLGGGTTFDVYLPPAANANATVLVADDDELVRRVVSEALTEAGYRVLVADSAEAALAIESGVDIALLDAHLDHRRRSDLGEQLRRRDPGLRVVIMTGLPGPEDYEFADAVLAKPFAFDELRATLARVLNDR
jgi:two-component system cell cycle sensor histidine kinase/response regulator CckA